MCSLLYRNAQRQGPICNLRLEEQARATSHETSNGEVMYVYKVWEHKTSGNFESENLVVPECLHGLITGYVEKHCPAAATDCGEYVFLTPAGKKSGTPLGQTLSTLQGLPN